MKFAARILLFTSLAATFSIAGCTQHGQFCHIIIVVQENRTPDDLFGACYGVISYTAPYAVP